MRLVVLFAGLACGAVAAAARAQAPDDGLYARARAAAIEVLVEDRVAGGGWLADERGSVLTAAHVIGAPGRRIDILSPSLGRLAAKVVAVDRGYDCALLLVEPRGEPYPFLPLADELPAPGRDIYLFGSPLFRRGVLIRGMVARDDIAYEFYSNEKWNVGVIHVSASIVHVTSGSPWMNPQGAAVGVQSGGLIVGGTPTSVAHMGPLPALRRLLTERTHAATPALGGGLEETAHQPPDWLAKQPPRLTGLVVRALDSGGPLGRAGVKLGEVLVAADGQELLTAAALENHLRTKKPGDVVKLRIAALEGQPGREVEVTLGLLEADWHAALPNSK